MTQYERFLAGLQLRHFVPREITRYGEAVRDGVTNDLPGAYRWKNLVPTLWVVDHLRELLGVPIRLTSIYRNPQYNAIVGGGSQSQHMRNAAIDFQVDGVSVQVAWNRLLALRQAGMFKGGMGLYINRPVSERFIHVDTRGRSATWGA